MEAWEDFEIRSLQRLCGMAGVPFSVACALPEDTPGMLAAEMAMARSQSGLSPSFGERHLAVRDLHDTVLHRDVEGCGHYGPDPGACSPES